MDTKLWQLESLLQDAHDALDRASQCALDISGYDGGRQADPEYGIPEVEPTEGWPLMMRLSAALTGLDIVLQALREDDELKAAIKAEHDEDADRESPEAMGLRP